VPLIETSHYQYYQVLALAKALSVRGAKIKLLLCDSQLTGCELKSIRSSKFDPCLTCRFNHKNVIPFFDFDVVKLSDFISKEQINAIRKKTKKITSKYPAKYVHNGVDIIPMTNDSVDRYYYGATPEDFSAELKDIREQHLETSMLGVTVARKIFEDWNPDQILGNMNVYSSWEPYLRVSTEKSIKFNLLSMSTFDYSKVVLNRQDLYLSDQRFLAWMELRASKKILPNEREELVNFMQERFSGVSPIFKKHQVFKSTGKKSNIDFLNIDPSKRNIFLFSNIYWDAGLAEYTSLYDGVVPWVLDTIDLLKNRNECHLYIKPHPAEVFDSSSSLKGVTDFIYERFPVLPKNVTIIAPELKVKPYDLFSVIDVGVVYNGTLALEMLLRDIPVIGAGLAPYNHLNSLTNPESRADYEKLLVGSRMVSKPNLDEVELFSYFYFIKSLIPWTLTEKSFGYDFKGFNFQSLDDLVPGQDKYLDHLCSCILDPKNTVVEGW
jgi:Capsule polysaccharide biosynthesis protein.